jgi:hypothetical protein
MKTLLLTLFTVLALNSYSQQTYVPDYNFENYLEGNGMGNGIWDDDYVTTANISGLINLDVSQQGIADLTGIEDFTALTALYCEDNQLTSLDVTQNTALINLYCFNNYLTSLDVTQNTALFNLDCNDNLLTSLDISNNTSLSVLNCEYTGITNLDVTQHTALTYLDCGNNLLTNLDVSQNTALTWLSCGNNLLTNLDVTQNTALQFLLCNGPLTSLDVTQNTTLQVLWCSGLQLTSLDVTQNTALTYLYCYNNQLTSLDVSQNTALTYLDCRINGLTSLDVTQNTALTDLGVTDNQLTSLDVSQNTALTGLGCADNLLTCLNVKNGNNLNMEIFSINNPNLTCIEVDDVAFAIFDWINNVDPGVTFSTNCNYPAGCLSTSTIKELTNTISLYPNPTNNLITLEIEGYNGVINVEVYDLQGRLLETTTNTIVSLKKHAKGIYVLKVSYGEITEEIRVVRE